MTTEPHPADPARPEPAAGDPARPAGEPLPEEQRRAQARASVLLGLLMIVGAVVVLVDAAGMRDSDDAVGPAAAPTFLGILLGLLGAGLVVQSLRVARTPKAFDFAARRLWRLAVMVVLLVAFAVLLPFLGYVLCAAALFTGAALLLGAPHPARVVAYGWTLAAVAFLIFDRLIGLSLPTGPWGF